MEEKSLFTLYEFLSEATSEISSIEEAIFEATSNVIAGELGSSYNITFLNSMITYINGQMSTWESISTRIPELDSFFAKACLSRQFMTMTSARVPVLDTNEISKFRPDYLKEFLDQSYTLIEDGMNNKLSEEDMYRIQSGDVLSTLKKNLVKNTLPHNLSNKEFINFDNKKIQAVNVAFVQDQLLPSLRSYEDQRGSMIDVADDICKVISSGNDIFQRYLDTYDRLMSGGKNTPKIPKQGFIVLGSCVHIYLDAAKYLTACLLRKIHCYIFNLQQFAKLKDQLATVLTSIDPVFEMTVEDSVPVIEGMLNDFMAGDSGSIELVINRVIERGKGLLKYTDITTSPFDQKVFFKIFEVINHFKDILQNIKEGAGTNFTIDELETQVNAITSEAPDISKFITDTTVYDHASGDELRAGIIAELYYAKNFFRKLSGSASALQTALSDLGNELSVSEVGVFSNRVRNQEIIDKLPKIQEDFYSLMRNVLTQYISRIDSLSILITERRKDDLDTLDMNNVTFLEMGLESMLETQKDLKDIEVDYAYTEATNRMYNHISISDPILFTEDLDSLDRPLDQEEYDRKKKAGELGKSTDDKKGSEKVSVQDGNTDTNKDKENEQNKDQNGDQKSNGKMEQNSQEKKEKADSILNKILEFFKNAKGIILKYFKKTSTPNTNWLKENKEYLLNRSYSNCTINILDWNTSVVYTDVLNKVAMNASSPDLENSIIQGTTNPEQIQARVLNNVGLNLPDGKNLNDRLERALKTTNNGEEISTIAISDGKIKELMPKMIEYCEYFYSNYENEINQAIDNAESKCTNLKNHINGKGEVSAEANVLWYSVQATVITTGAKIMDAAKQRAENYIEAMNALAKNNPEKSKEKNKEEGNENSKNTSNENNGEENTSSQPK